MLKSDEKLNFIFLQKHIWVFISEYIESSLDIFTEFAVGSTASFTLDANKYAKSFASYKNFVKSLGVDELPESLLTYTVTSTATEIIVSGLTETTVRVGVVDLVTKSNGAVKMTMTRPEVTFRVYKTKEPEEETNVSFGGLFGEEEGDY